MVEETVLKLGEVEGRAVRWIAMACNGHKFFELAGPRNLPNLPSNDLWPKGVEECRNVGLFSVLS